MNFTNPGALWFALLAVPIVILYLLRIRRRRVEVSSTLLWQMALRDRQANAPWQRLRRNLLLLLQLILLSLLVLAAARLAFPVRSIAGGSIVLLLDGSASMLASDEAPSRFARAVEIGQDLVRETSPDATSAAILVTHQPSILFSGERDRARAVQRLSEATPDLGEADWAAAFSLAGGLQQGGDVSDTTFIILSDGGLPPEPLPLLPAKTEYIPVGQVTGNLAVSALAARPLPDGESAQLFVRASNYGQEQRSAVLEISRNGVLLHSVEVILQGGESLSLVFDGLSTEAAGYEARLRNIQADLPLDSLSLDDGAFAVLAPPTSRRVLLVSPGNLFLERLLLLMPNMEASRIDSDQPGALRLEAADFDLFILDGVLPEGNLPAGNLLLVNPPPNPLFDVSGQTEDIGEIRTSEVQLARFLDWSPVHIYRTRLIEAPSWAEVWVQAEGNPLVFAGETGGRRIAAVGFDLHESDLPLQVAFPILFANLFAYLAPPGAVLQPNGSRINEPVHIAVPLGTTGVLIRPPGDEPVEIPGPEREVLFTRTGNPGLYTVELKQGETTTVERFSVNLFSPVESDITVRPEVQVGQEAIGSTQRNEVSNRELWAWLVALALGVLLLEWLAYHRRLGQPNLTGGAVGREHEGVVSREDGNHSGRG